MPTREGAPLDVQHRRSPLASFGGTTEPVAFAAVVAGCGAEPHDAILNFGLSVEGHHCPVGLHPYLNRGEAHRPLKPSPMERVAGHQQAFPVPVPYVDGAFSFYRFLWVEAHAPPAAVTTHKNSFSEIIREIPVYGHGKIAESRTLLGFARSRMVPIDSAEFRRLRYSEVPCGRYPLRIALLICMSRLALFFSFTTQANTQVPPLFFAQSSPICFLCCFPGSWSRPRPCVQPPAAVHPQARPRSRDRSAHPRGAARMSIWDYWRYS